MGLGELSVHILFWVLEQYREEKNMTLLLDEPDAYLPPVGSGRLLAGLQELCRKRDWGLVVSTHSEEMIRTARENDGLLVLSRATNSAVESFRSWRDGPDVAAHLLSTPPIDLVLFCEDESAAALTRALLGAGATDRGRGTAVVWKDGTGYLNTLSRQLPRYASMQIKFGVVFDGDQRGKEGRAEHSSGWKAIFLPTDQDPDDLFKSLTHQRTRIATRLQVKEAAVAGWLDALGGSDKHDWVNGLCTRHGNRTAMLDALADLWVGDHPDECKTFNSDVEASRANTVR